ncbi:MAG: hypothetical protein Q9227_008523 [Pyrenula ochraceoflavens]
MSSIVMPGTFNPLHALSARAADMSLNDAKLYHNELYPGICDQYPCCDHNKWSRGDDNWEWINFGALCPPYYATSDMTQTSSPPAFNNNIPPCDSTPPIASANPQMGFNLLEAQATDTSTANNMPQASSPTTFRNDNSSWTPNQTGTFTATGNEHHLPWLPTTEMSTASEMPQTSSRTTFEAVSDPWDSSRTNTQSASSSQSKRKGRPPGSKDSGPRISKIERDGGRRSKREEKDDALREGRKLDKGRGKGQNDRIPRKTRLETRAQYISRLLKLPHMTPRDAEIIANCPSKSRDREWAIDRYIKRRNEQNHGEDSTEPTLPSPVIFEGYTTRL